MSGEMDRISASETWVQQRLAGWVAQHTSPVDIQTIAKDRTDQSNINLYIHIPFCRRICAFCSFETVVGSTENRNNYVQSLLRHSKRILPIFIAGQTVNSVFIGGGTPSLLDSDQVSSVLGGVREFADLSGSRVTFELHPENVNAEYVAALQSLGVNRLSVGIQNLSEEERALLKRDHSTPQQDLEVLRILTDSGVEYNVDLIYGSPNQTITSWSDTLKKIIGEADPSEITAYQYTNASYSGTERMIRLGQLSRPGPLLRRQMYELTLKLMREAGYIQTSALGFSRVRKNDQLRSLNSSNDILGLGPRTYSRSGSWFFINEAKTRDFTRGEDDNFRGLKIPRPIKLLVDNFVPLFSRPELGGGIPLVRDFPPEVLTQIFAIFYQMLK